MSKPLKQVFRFDLSFIYLWLIVYIFFLFSGCANFRRDRDFTLGDRKKVDYIGIFGRDTVELKQSETGWSLNSDLEADPTAIENFFYAFENIEITGATTGEYLDTLIPRKIIVKRNHKLFRFNFYSAKDYYLLNKQGEKGIYRVGVISAPDADLETVFSDHPAEWRKREFISIVPDELQEIRVIPQGSFGEGFVMRKDSAGFRVFDLSGKELPEEAVDREKTLLYVSYLDEIFFTEEIREDTVMDRIVNSTPLYEFFIKTQGDAGYSFGVFPLYARDGEEELFYGAVKFQGKKSILKVNYANLDFLFQNLDYFTIE